MKRLALASILALMMAGFSLGAEIVVPTDRVPFEVPVGDNVRIPVSGIAGTNVTAKVVLGKATASVTGVTERVNGRIPIGLGKFDVDVVPNGKGKYQVDVTVAPPNGPAKVDVYLFEVK